MSSTSRGVAAGPRLRRPAYPGSRHTPDDEPHYRQEAWRQTGAEAFEELKEMRMTQQASSGELTGQRRPARVMMTPLTAFVLRHRRWIVGFWLLALVAGGVAAGEVAPRPSTDFSLPGQPGYAAAQPIMRVSRHRGPAPAVPNLTVP